MFDCPNTSLCSWSNTVKKKMVQQQLGKTEQKWGREGDEYCIAHKQSILGEYVNLLIN